MSSKVLMVILLVVLHSWVALSCWEVLTQDWDSIARYFIFAALGVLSGSVTGWVVISRRS